MAQINEATTLRQLSQIIGGEHDTRTMPNGIRYAICGRVAFIDGAFGASDSIVIDLPSLGTRYVLNFSTEEGACASVLVETNITKVSMPNAVKGKKFMVHGFAILPR